MTSIFVNTYQLYKKQTDQLAQWLVDTAVRYGYSPEKEFPGSDRVEQPRRGSGEASASAVPEGKGKRAAANGRDSKATGGTQSPNPEGASYAIRLSQFVQLATSIAERARNNNNNNNNKKVPRAIPELILQIIKMRGSVSLYYNMQSRSRPDDSRLREANEKHIYFISRLEDVLRILETVAESSASVLVQPQGPLETSREQAKKPSMDDLSNRFNALEVEEPIGLELDANPLIPSQRLGKSKPEQDRKVVYDASESEDTELDFAVFCLFNDLRRMRTFLGQNWQDYKSGKLDLMTVSVLTNSAFGFAQSIDAEFCRSYPGILSPQFHNNPIIPMYLLSCLRSGVDFNHKENPDDTYNYEMQEIGEFLYVSVYFLLESFSRVLEPGHIPLAKKGYFGIYNPKSNRGTMSYRQKMAEDKIILMEKLPVFCVLGQARHGLFALDELTKGLATLYRTKEIPLWLVFASQIFLDITHVFRASIGDAYVQIKRTAIVTKINMSRIMDSPLHSLNWPKQNQKHTKDVWNFAQDWIMTDGLDRLSQAFYSTSFPTYEHEPYGLLKSHPLLCGTIESSLRLSHRETGIHLSMAWGSILYVGHLYNALRQTHVIDLEWPDMDLFIAIHSAKTLFVGDLPTTLEDCKKRYDLMMGVAVENFAKNKKNRGSGKVVHNKAGPRNWQTDSPIVHTIKERYLTQRGSIAWSVQNIEAILNEANQQGLPQHLRNRWNKSHQLSHMQVLSILRSALSAEYKVLHFDYISMHYRCLDFLRQLRVEIDEDLKSQFGPEYLEREDQLSNLVGYILMAAVMFERAMTIVKDSRQSFITNLPMVSKTGVMMKKLIDQFGEVESKKLR